MSRFGDFAHDLNRLREIASVMRRHGFGPAMRNIPLLRRSAREEKVIAAQGPASTRFANMLEELGPTFVKLGQILSTRPDLLPADFIRALSRLQDQVPPFPFEQVVQQIEQGLGAEISAHFAYVDETPLASASIAQVHSARLKNGDEVVLKVQRPGIAEQVRADASILVLLAQLLEAVIEEASHYRAADLAKEFEQGLRTELDFMQESRNLQAFYHLNQGRAGIRVPRFYPEHSAATILTMERIQGRRITELPTGEDASRTHQTIERLMLVAFSHLFEDGTFHGDPHPGNVLITDDDEIAFIDFGLVGRLARDMQDRLLLLLIALSLRDADTCARILVRMGEPATRISLVHFRDAISRLLDSYLGIQIQDVNISSALADLLELSTRFGVRLPRELALLSKASLSLDGIVRMMHPTMNPSLQITRRAQELMVERFDPSAWRNGSLRSALQVGMLAQELPLQVSQMLYDLERGQLQVAIRAEELAHLDRNLRGLGMTIFGGLVASASLLGGFYVLARQEWVVWGIQVLPAVAFTVAGTAFGIAFTWYLTGGKLRKIPMSKLVQRLQAKWRR